MLNIHNRDILDLSLFTKCYIHSLEEGWSRNREKLEQEWGQSPLGADVE